MENALPKFSYKLSSPLKSLGPALTDTWSMFLFDAEGLNKQSETSLY